MSRVNVLVFPCGSENASEIHQALTHSIHVNLYGASSVDDHGRFLFANYAGDLPRINAAEFQDAFKRLIDQWAIDLVFATHDSVQEYLAPIAQEMGVMLVNGDPHTTQVARRKSLTYALFADQPWAPQIFADATHVECWPAVVKPDLGQGGQGVTVVEDATQAAHALSHVEQPLLVEWLPGEEITVDCFSDRNHEIILVAPRTRERVRAGISMRCKVLPASPEVQHIAQLINSRLTLRGPWFFQLKRARNGDWKLLEISCRVAGAMVTQRARGINLPLLTVHDYMDRDVSVLPITQISRIERRISTFAQFDYEFDNIYIDFDETIILNGKAIASTMDFLYRMIAKDKKVFLITRHAGNLSSSLEQARISPFIFDDIIHLKAKEKKSAFILGRSIFIDNHFPERLDVAATCGIPVFDVDALELIH